MTSRTSRLNRTRATKVTETTAASHSKPPGKGAAPVPAAHSTCQAKNPARWTTTPTTAAVMPVSGAVNLRSPWVAATSGAPQRMNRNDGRKVKKVATPAPAAAGRGAEDLPGSRRR